MNSKRYITWLTTFLGAFILALIGIVYNRDMTAIGLTIGALGTISTGYQWHETKRESSKG